MVFVGKNDGVAAAESDVACGEGGAFGGDVVDEKAGGVGGRCAAGADDGVILEAQAAAATAAADAG